MTSWFRQLWTRLYLWQVSPPKLGDEYFVTADGDHYRLLDVKASQGYAAALEALRPGEQLCRIVFYDTIHLFAFSDSRDFERHMSYDFKLAGVIRAPERKRSHRVFRSRDSFGQERHRRITLER